MQKLADFKLPQFFNYPPYFTYQTLLQSFSFFFSLKDYRLKKCFSFQFAACEGHS